MEKNPGGEDTEIFVWMCADQFKPVGDRQMSAFYAVFLLKVGTS